MATTLYEHRVNIKRNALAYSFDLGNDDCCRLSKTLVIHLSNMGFRLSLKKHGNLLRAYILLLFEVQDRQPIFNIDKTDLPLCWNRPRDWGLNYIKYEWGHLSSINQNIESAHRLTNLGLYSARCNQHIQASMDIEELLPYKGGLGERIAKVISQRQNLFASDKWRSLEEKIQKLRRTP